MHNHKAVHLCVCVLLLHVLQQLSLDTSSYYAGTDHTCHTTATDFIGSFWCVPEECSGLGLLVAAGLWRTSGTLEPPMFAGTCVPGRTSSSMFLHGAHEQEPCVVEFDRKVHTMPFPRMLC